MTTSVNANMGMNGGPRIHSIQGAAGFYVKNTSQGATGDATVTLDLGQQYQVSELTLSWYSNQTWPAGGKVDLDDGSGNWVNNVFDSGHGTALGSAADGAQRIPFAPHAARYVRLTGYFDPNAAQGGLLENIEVFGGTGECTPSCSGKACGDNPSDGCGGTCTIVCQDGQSGCKSDTDCNTGSTCIGRTPGSAVANICVPPICLTNPKLGGCGFNGAPCGPSCSSNPVCQSDQECQSGYVCGSNNGFRYGLPGKNVCEKPACQTNPVATGCGTINSECGTCACTPDCSNVHCGDANVSDGCGGTCVGTCSNYDAGGCASDSECAPGSQCIIGGAERLGLNASPVTPAQANACMPVRCASPILAAPDCGTVSSLCGLCPVKPDGCSSRECGVDPQTGAQCGGACPAGNYCNAMGLCTQPDQTDPITFVDSFGYYGPIVLPPAPPAVPVGAISGEFSVSDRGSATYTIPIEVPPGRNGIEPALSLSYASSSANGALGVGWSLDGLGTIDVCSKTYAQDGYAQPTGITSYDSFCMNGQRLIQVKPNEYRTEVESFSKILVFYKAGEPSISTQVDYFKVFTKDKRILWFGDAPDAKGAFAHKSERTWALDRVEDRFGNNMQIGYQSTLAEDDLSSTELVPSSIVYTGNGSLRGTRQLTFDYDAARADRLIGSQMGGGEFARTLRLTNVNISANDTFVRKYSLNYETAPNGASRINNIQECAGQTLVCKPATKFAYFDEQGFDNGVEFNPNEQPSNGYETFLPRLPLSGTTLSTGSYDILSTLSNTPNANLVATMPTGLLAAASLAIPTYGVAVSAALNILELASEGDEERNWFIRRSYDYVRKNNSYLDACGTTAQPADHILVDGITGAENLYETCTQTNTTPLQTTVVNGQPSYAYKQFSEAPRVWLVDIDGDGVQDKLYCDNDQYTLNYKLAKNSARHATPKDALDADRDGSIAAPALCTVVCTNPDKPGLEHSCGPVDEPISASFDVDGDGAGDLLVYTGNSNWEAFGYDSRGIFLKALSRTGAPIIDLTPFELFLIDANGDGLRDILALPSIDHGAKNQVPVLWTNIGTELRPTLLQFDQDAGRGQASHFPAFVTDYDHDGIEELLEPSPSTTDDPNQPRRSWIIRRIREGGIVSELENAQNQGPGFPGVLGDFDGDGNPDLMTSNPASGAYFLHHGSGRRQNLLKSVTDGLGRWTKNPIRQHECERRACLYACMCYVLMA